jgi:hypothetical protein
MTKTLVAKIIKWSGLVKSWSFSRLSDFEQCPAKFKYKHIDKLKEPGNAAMQRGNDVHLYAEAYVSAKVPPLGWQDKEPRPAGTTKFLGMIAKGFLPDELQNFKEEFLAIREAGYESEVSWNFNKDWEPLFQNGWSPAIWLIIKCDTHKIRGTHATFIDYKTGKKYADKHAKTLDLYALATMLRHPEVETVMAALWYLDIKDPNENELIENYTRADLPRLMKYFNLVSEPLFTTTNFVPQVNSLCRFCHFRKENGGPCKY